MDETKRLNVEDINIDKEKNKTEDIPETEQVVETKDETQKGIEVLNNIEENITDKSSLEAIVKNDYQEKTIVQMEVPNLKKIGVACDHRGYKLKQKLTKYLNKIGYTVVDYGGEGDKNDNYTDYGFKLAEAIKNHEIEKGIAICGSGIGISIACNKVSGVRCAKVNNIKEARLTRKDNDANVIALNGKMPTFRAKDILDVFLKTEFANTEKYKNRVDALNNYKG